MKTRLQVYEVEHYGDVSHAIGALRRVGITVVEAGQVNEESESVVLLLDAPVATAAELRALLDRAEVIYE
jgi:hypothetical protein